MKEIRNLPILLFSVVFAINIVYCFGEIIDKAFFVKPITIEVIGSNDINGWSDIWITSSGNSVDFTGRLEVVENRGEFEYRKAADFGYSCDMIVSTGDNIGHRYIIRDYDLRNEKLVAYTTVRGGDMKVTFDGESFVMSTYSEVSGFSDINIEFNKLLYIYIYILKIIFGLVLLVIIYKIIEKSSNCGDEVVLYSTDGKRDPSVDIVRTMAAFLVTFVHSFLACKFYDYPRIGEIMMCMSFVNWISFDCIPLFMLITGYLCINRLDIKKTYKNFVSIYATYVCVVLISTVFSCFYQNQGFVIKDFLNDIISVDRAWYVTMYLGFLLLIPFINRIWRGLSKNEKQIFIISLTTITSLYTISNIPFPRYWVSLYPFTYYFIGVYIREFPLKFKTYQLFLMFLFVTGCQTVSSITGTVTTSVGNTSYYYSSLIVIVSAVLLFSLLIRIKVKNKWICKALELIGKNTLGIYLFGVLLVDNRIYPYFQAIYTTPPEFAKIQMIPVLINFSLSAILAILLSFIINKVTGLYRRKQSSDVSSPYHNKTCK